MRRNVSLLLVALMLVPTAAAWPWDDVVITVADSRVGDKYWFNVDRVNELDGEIDETHGNFVAIVEPPTMVADKFGVLRAAEPWLGQRIAKNGSIEYTSRCFALAGGEGTVRRDPVGGEHWGYDNQRDETVMGVTTGTYRTARSTSTESTFSSNDCEARNLLAGRVFAEGERVPFDSLLGWNDRNVVSDSEPARATTFHRRPALAITFDLAELLKSQGVEGGEGSLTVTLADGLPGMAVIHGVFTGMTDGKHVSQTFHHELLGFAEGSGPALARQRGEVIPTENPTADFLEYQAGVVPDEAFDFPYSYAEAYAAVTTDATGETPVWLRAHPKAVVQWVWYSRDVGISSAGLNSQTLGTWWIGFRDGATTHVAMTSRQQIAPVGLPSALRGVTTQTNNDGYEVKSDGPPITQVPERTIDSQGMLALTSAHGIPNEKVRSFSYGVASYDDRGQGYLYFSVSDVDGNAQKPGEIKGRTIQGDAAEGSVSWIGNERRVQESSGILNPQGEKLADSDSKTSALTALAGPAFGAGLAGGAALTGLALLVVAIKFLLIPLFTRLRRDRLLDNPVRARLYERVRSEPGIHRAELVDYGGIGEGATRHHLDQLVKNHLLVAMKEDGFVRYYASGEVPPEIARREAALRAGSARAVYDLLVAEPHLSLREAGARLGMSAPSVHKTKKKLEKAGLIPAGAAVAAQVAEA